MIWACMSGKGPVEMAIITSTISAQVDIEILDTSLTPSIENRFGDKAVIFRITLTFYYNVKTFFRKDKLKIMASKQSKSNKVQ